MNRLSRTMRPALTARMRSPISLVLTALVILGLAAPLAAQEPPKDMVAFKASVTGPVLPGFVIPVDPPMVAVIGRSTGQLPLLGQTTYIEKAVVHLSPEGTALSVTDGVGVFTGANGDAVFITQSGLIRPTGPELVFIITGGRGKFQGASGSGAMTFAVDAAKNEITIVFDGKISAPK